MQLVIISGPPGAGKSAAADALCQRYDRMLHIDVAVLRSMLRMGLLRPWDESSEGQMQRKLFIGSAADMASRFLDAGYGVVIDDAVTQDELQLYRDALADRVEPLHFVVLLPTVERLLSGGPPNQDRVRALHERFASWQGVAVIEPGDLAPELVADRIMALASQGRALLPKSGGMAVAGAGQG